MEGLQYILVFHECLFFGNAMKHTLLNPNQLRNADIIIVQDIPKQYDENSTHDILVSIPKEKDLRIPLSMKGIMSGFTSAKPTAEDLDNVDIPHLVMTLNDLWDPTSTAFAEKEEIAKRASTPKISQVNVDQRCGNSLDYLPRVISSVMMREQSREVIEAGEEILSDETLYKRMIASVNVASDDLEGTGLSGRGNEDVFPPGDEPTRTINALSTDERKSALTPEILAKRFNCGLATAKRTLKTTTQYGLRNVMIPAERRSRQKTSHLRFPTIAGKTYSDTFKSTVTSTRMNTGGQMFTNGLGFDRFYPLRKKSEAHVALMKDIHFAGIPQIMVTDGAKEETLGKWGETCREYRTKQETTVPYSPWQMKAEKSIGEFKKATSRTLRRTHAPKRLWDFAGEWCTDIRRITASDIPQLNGVTPEEYATGHTPDISAHGMFDWYQPIWYWTPTIKFPHQKKTLGRWLGVNKDCSAPMAFYILSQSGHQLTRKDVWAITRDEAEQPSFKEDLKKFDEDVNSEIGDSLSDSEIDPELAYVLPPIPGDFVFDEEENLDPLVPEFSPQEADDSSGEIFDQYLSAELLVPHQGEMRKGRVIARKRDAHGNPVGVANNNPLLDSRMYEIEFPEGNIEAYTANTIAENIYSQVDAEGRSYSVLDEIQDHRSSNAAVTKEDSNARNQQTTKGWDLQVKWKDGTTDWIP